VTAVPPRVLAVCVDDIGLVDGVAETVVDLAAAERVCAASCVTTAPGWRRAAAVLARAKAPLGVGLHFNLSEGAPLSAALASHWPTLPSLGRLMILAHLGRLPVSAIAAEFRAQADAFADGIGALPTFVDGHQHVHALPGVRDAVLAEIARWPTPPAVRNTGRLMGPGAAFKRLFNSRLEIVCDLHVERVQPVRPVQGQHANRVTHLELDRFESHFQRRFRAFFAVNRVDCSRVGKIPRLFFVYARS